MGMLRRVFKLSSISADLESWRAISKGTFFWGGGCSMHSLFE